MRHAGISWAYVTLIVCSMSSASGDEPAGQPKIIVVGAGPSGIAAASKLFDHGFKNITILEAENRIGGRIHTTWFDESWMDLGGQWVHGQTNNIAFELASPLGLLEVPGAEKKDVFLMFNSEGDLIPASITENFLQLYLNLSESTNEELNRHNGSLGDYYTRIITTEATKIPGATETLTKQFIKVLESLENIQDAADSWYNISKQESTEFWDCPGNIKVNWKDRGYKTILEILMKKYPNPKDELPVMNNTVLNTEVANINYNSTEGKVLVELSDGTKHEADHVIVTPSLGVLKEQYETLFTPQLPEPKVKTIKNWKNSRKRQRLSSVTAFGVSYMSLDLRKNPNGVEWYTHLLAGLGMGTVGKIFFFYEAAWWPQNITGLTFMWNESDRQEYETDPAKKWLLDVVGFFPVNPRPRALLGWVTGPGVRYMETLPESQVLNQMHELFEKFVGKAYNIPRPTRMLRSQWYTNKHFRGTYSFRSMESEKADVWAEDLAAPLLVNGKPIVMFAGEATNPHHFSTVHGAIETGFREADRVINLYRKTPE